MQTASDELRDLYKELILDHARSPRNFGKLPECTHSADGINPLCGDKLKVYLAIDGGDRINDIKFEGSGCAISVASASLMTDTVIGRLSSDALATISTVVDALTGSDTALDASLEKLAALQGVREFPSRVKCATLAWHALRAAIDGAGATATTE